VFEGSGRSLRSLVIGLLIAAGLLLVAGVALLAHHLIDPDDYRAEIAAGVEALTGREVRIDGRVGLSLVPQPTLSMAQASLASRPDADEAFHLTAERLDLRVAVLPLLRGEIQVVEASVVPMTSCDVLPTVQAPANASPSWSSSFRTAWLTALGVSASSCAAARNEPIRPADSKARNSASGTFSSIATGELDSPVVVKFPFVVRAGIPDCLDIVSGGRDAA
jgi:hypothetical protein